MGESAVEFRGVDNLVYAPVVKDDKEAFECGPVKPLAPVAEIARSTSSDSATHYYDNQPKVGIRSTGSDEITISSSVVDLPTLADVTSQDYDADLDMMVEGEANPGYFALGYRTKDTSGSYRYVWRLKGQFGIPDEASHTEDDGTDANGQELKFTGVSTIHKFDKNGKSAKSIVVQEGKADLSAWFDTVQTPDTVKSAAAAVVAGDGQVA